MIVKMLVEAAGMPDCRMTKIYLAGEVYEMPDHLAEVFLNAGFAEIQEDEPKNESKDQGQAPENKKQKNFWNKK